MLFGVLLQAIPYCRLSSKEIADLPPKESCFSLTLSLTKRTLRRRKTRR
jgi:hypothetical protein